MRHKVLDLIGDLALAGRQDSGAGGGGAGGACDAYCSCAKTYAGPVGVGAGSWVRRSAGACRCSRTPAPCHSLVILGVFGWFLAGELW